MEENNKFRKDTKLYIYTDIDSYNKMIENFNKDIEEEKKRSVSVIEKLRPLQRFTNLFGYPTDEKVGKIQGELGEEKLRKLLATGYSSDIDPCKFLDETLLPITKKNYKKLEELYSWGTTGKLSSQDLKKTEEIFLNPKKNGAE